MPDTAADKIFAIYDTSPSLRNTALAPWPSHAGLLLHWQKTSLTNSSTKYVFGKRYQPPPPPPPPPPPATPPPLIPLDDELLGGVKLATLAALNACNEFINIIAWKVPVP